MENRWCGWTVRGRDVGNLVELGFRPHSHRAYGVWALYFVYSFSFRGKGPWLVIKLFRTVVQVQDISTRASVHGYILRLCKCLPTYTGERTVDICVVYVGMIFVQLHTYVLPM